MRTNLFTTIAALTTAMMLNASAASATIYKFTFSRATLSIRRRLETSLSMPPNK